VGWTRVTTVFLDRCARLRLVTARPILPTSQLVAGAAASMIAAQLMFRGWALYGSWFYTDDYRLLYDAQSTSLNLSYLLTPFDSQFMPFGRLVAATVASSGHVNWPLAATITLGLQLLASIACLWMLVTLFGHRWGILAPLGVYLTCAITMPALMWWAASLNQMPMQIVCFTAVGCWVRYARSRHLRWLAFTMLALALGLLCYVKTLLVFAVLAYLLVAYFSAGKLPLRVRSAVGRYWPAALATGALGVGFLAYYTAHVPQLFATGDRPLTGQLADTMLGTSLTSGAIGGPWHWNASNPPTGYAEPPPWTVHIAWCILLITGLVCALRWQRTGRAWVLLAGYAGASYLLLLTSRAPVTGALIGYEYRYLTDIVPVLVLCLSLAAMPLVGADEPIRERVVPLLAVTPGPRVIGGLVAAICLSGLISSRSYAEIWHQNNPGDTWAHAAMAGLRNRGRVDMADQLVPDNVVPGFAFPNNTSARLLPLLVGNARFPTVTSELHVLAENGDPRRALINTATTSRRGFVPDCGWKVTNGSTFIPMRSTAFDFSWWIRIGYLATADDMMALKVNETVVQAPVRRGVHSVFFRVDGKVDSVVIGGLMKGTTVCVDTVEVGLPVPGASQ
jgi:hypothetical protein